MDRAIFSVGDSHSLRCFEDHPHIADSTTLFGYNKLDGKTAFNLIRHEKQVRKIRQSLRDKHLIFVFGEVDVRIHIKYKAVQTNTPPEVLIRNTADRYTDYVRGLRDRGYSIHVFNVVPTGNFSTPEALRWRKNLCYPFLASREERTRYTEEMNSRLQEFCAGKDIPFIDIYRHLVDQNGRRKKELIYDFSHLNSKTADLVMAHYDFERGRTIVTRHRIFVQALLPA
jgi:hypothetical protein